MLLDTLRAAAKDKGLSLKSVAELAGIKYDTLLSWNEHVPNALALVKVAKVLETTAEELLHNN